MPSRLAATIIATAAMLALAVPPVAWAPAAALEMPLCGGGIVTLVLGGKGRPIDGPGACHAMCAAKRDNDEDSETL